MRLMLVLVLSCFAPALANPPPLALGTLAQTGENALLGASPGGPASVLLLDQCLAALQAGQTQESMKLLEQLAQEYPATASGAVARRLAPVLAQDTTQPGPFSSRWHWAALLATFGLGLALGRWLPRAS